MVKRTTEMSKSGCGEQNLEVISVFQAKMDTRVIALEMEKS